MNAIWLKDTEVAARFGLHRSWTWRMLKTDQTFPKPVSVSAGCTRWRRTDIERWEAAKSEVA